MLDIHPFYKIYILVGFNDPLFAMINSWKMHPQSTIFVHVSTIKFPTFSRSSKSLLVILGRETEGEEGRMTPNRLEEGIPYDIVLENHFETY